MKLFIALPAFGFTAGRTSNPKKNEWHMDHNKWINGGLVFTARASKGFNKSLVFCRKAISPEGHPP